MQRGKRRGRAVEAKRYKHIQGSYEEGLPSAKPWKSAVKAEEVDLTNFLQGPGDHQSWSGKVGHWLVRLGKVTGQASVRAGGWFDLV